MLEDADTIQLLELRNQAQAKLEKQFPATIDLKHSTGAAFATGVVCAGGTVRETGVQLMRGGLLAEFELAFRVRRALLPAKPEVGMRLIFDGEPKRLMRVIDPATDVVYVLACDSIAK